MYSNKNITVIIPAYNEEKCLPLLLKDIPEYIDLTIVVDNNSTDNTVEVARNNGALVVYEPVQGYGATCLCGLKYSKDADIIVVLDADHTDDPQNMHMLLDPIIRSGYDMVISNRFNPGMEKGAMTFAQYFGNKLSVFLIRLFWHYNYHDMGPFRAIRKKALDTLYLRDTDFGWNIEMQIRAVQNGLKIYQIDMPYRKRTEGKSKISGTVKGVLSAGTKIIYKILQLKLTELLCGESKIDKNRRIHEV